MHQVPEITRIALPERTRGMEQRKRILQRNICGVVLWALTACSPHSGGNNGTGSPTDNDARVLRRGLPGEPRTLDPQLADDDFSFQIVRDLYEGLTAEDSYGQIVPGVSSAWTVDDSGTVYTFSLRPDAKWSNGDRILASEFVEGMRRAVDPATASGSAGLLSVIKGASEIIAGREKASDLAVTSVGDATVRIQLEHPAPFVLQILSQPIASPIHNSSKASSGIVYS